MRHLRKGSANEHFAEQQRETETLHAVSGVTSVAFASRMPMSSSGNYNSVAADRKQVNESATASFYFAPDSLVKTLGLKLAEGRDLRPEEVTVIDSDTAPDDLFPSTVLVTRALVEKVWPGASTFVGKTLDFGTGETANGARALGARRVDILRYFLTENFIIASVSVLCGVLLAISLNQLLVSKLEMAKLPLDYLFVGAGVFWAVGVAAVYGPAWRAATISPATATRST